MNKEIPQGNKIIYQKMFRKERQRQLNRLQQIKAKPTSLHPQDPVFFRQTSLFDSEKNLEVERNNIALFNKIASIIKEKPKVEIAKSRSYVQSLDQALFKQEKKMQELKQKNENILRRLIKQQPTIKNQSIYKDRVKNERYLSFIGRYPFRNSRRVQTQYQIPKDQQASIFHQKTLDFDISISHKAQEDQYIFLIKDLADLKQYKLTMDGQRFKDELANSNLSYQKMIGRLRMEKNGEMSFTLPNGKSSPRVQPEQ